MLRPLALRFIMVLACAGAGIGRGQVVLDSVDCGGWSLSSLVLNENAGVMYGRRLYPGAFFAVYCSTDYVIAQIPLWDPMCVVFSSSSNKAYCTFTSHGTDSVLVVNGSNQQRLKAIPLPGVTEPIWDSVSDRLYLNCSNEDHTAVLDCRTDSVVDYIPVPSEPVGLTINTRHRKLYVHSWELLTGSVIDMNTNRVVASFNPGLECFTSCYSAVADKYYCNSPQGVAVVCGSGDTLIKHIRLPQGYLAVAMVSVEPESLLMVATSGYPTDSVFVIDVKRDSVVSAMLTGRSPRAFAFSPVSGVVYCANATSDDLAVVDRAGTRVLSLVPVGDCPMSLLVCRRYEKLYVGHANSSKIYVVRDRLGIEEAPSVVATPSGAGATIVRSAYMHAAAEPATLVDAVGRRVLSIKVGRNDLSRLQPGVYIVVTPRVGPHRGRADSAGGLSRRKVVKVE